jgi:hypothetical protein
VKLAAVPLVIVKETEVLSISPPPVPVTVIVEVPTAEALLTVSVRVDVPAPPEMLAGLKLAVTPEGRPLADNATALLNPPAATLVIAEVPELPAFTLSDAGLAESAKLAVVPLVIVRLMAAVSVKPPPAPVMVTVEAPMLALLLAVRVSVDEPEPPEMLVGLKLAVTPDGKPLAERETALLNPPDTLLEIVEVPELPAWTLNDVGSADNENPATPPVTTRKIAVAFVMLPAVPATPIR